jgi:hypothetical protein
MEIYPVDIPTARLFGQSVDDVRNLKSSDVTFRSSRSIFASEKHDLASNKTDFGIEIDFNELLAKHDSSILCRRDPPLNSVFATLPVYRIDQEIQIHMIIQSSKHDLSILFKRESDSNSTRSSFSLQNNMHQEFQLNEECKLISLAIRENSIPQEYVNEILVRSQFVPFRHLKSSLYKEFPLIEEYKSISRGICRNTIAQFAIGKNLARIRSSSSSR